MADSDHDSANGKSPLVESPSAVAANGRAVKRVASRVPSAADLHDPNIFITAKNVLEQERHKWADETRGWTWYNWLAFYVPIAGWLPNYNVKAWLLVRAPTLCARAPGHLHLPLLPTPSASPPSPPLQWDVFAGLSTACMVIPQGMSYANLAGLPYVYGLYGAFVPTIIYALFGTSRQLVVGPVAVTSILLANGLNKVFDGNVNEDPNNPTDAALQDQYNQAAVQVRAGGGGGGGQGVAACTPPRLQARATPTAASTTPRWPLWPASSTWPSACCAWAGSSSSSPPASSQAL